MRAGPPRTSVAEEATADGPTRRRTSWSLRTIVEDVAGRPIEELQDPDRPVHPYLQARPAPRGSPSRTAPAAPDEDGYDPVAHISPPLVGATGRAFHGPDHEHHRETLARQGTPVDGPAAGPLRKPERIYLHYLLLHMDRLSDSALRYLRTAVDEEMNHRSPPLPPATPPPRAVGVVGETPATPPPRAVGVVGETPAPTDPAP
jgi:hypothetical protein